MREQPSNLQRDILALNMERQMEELASQRYGKAVRECTNQELYYVMLAYCKRLLTVTGLSSGEKRLYYLSAEFMVGKLLANNLINLKVYDRMKALLEKNGKSLSEIEEYEPEPSLGCGSLGRTSSCFLDSVATLDLPGEGIGLNYHFGMFRQVFDDYRQREEPAPWMENESWEVRSEVSFRVNFGDGQVRSRMYDIDVIGWDSRVNKLHLFDLETVDESLVKQGISFDREAIDRNLTLFLYPDDSDEKGRLLCLHQQYFLVSNAAQWILHEMRERRYDLKHMYDHAVIQINNTYPSLIIPELIRILTEEKAMSMDEAVEVVTKTCAYSHHTLLAEAMEVRPLHDLMRVVPQLVPVVRELDRRVRSRCDDPEVQIIDGDDMVHLVRLILHYTFSANGVTKIHTGLMQQIEVHPLSRLYPDRFSNRTNGITFRRWLLSCNHPLADYLSAKISDAYKRNADRLEDLLAFQNDPDTLRDLENIKQGNKRRLAGYVRQHDGIELLTEGIFDIQVGLLHEYRRQQMNALYIIRKYQEVKSGRLPARPVNFLFGAKAGTHFEASKDFLHLLMVLQELINEDPEVNPYLRMAFVENFDVTYAEQMVPACEISEQIPLASREASATFGMKFMLNGAVTLGTEDGANVEIHKLVGDDNIFIFGMDAQTVLGHEMNKDYMPRSYYERSPVVREAVDFITGPECLRIGHRGQLEHLREVFVEQDPCMALADFEEYVSTKDRMLEAYEDRERWNRMSLVNIAKAGYFSGDRVAAEYNREIWHLR